MEEHQRANSLEPCAAGRPNPFEDITEHTSRKRQRTSRGGSRSRSVDTSRDLDIVPDSILLREGNGSSPDPNPTPSTPTRKHEQVTAEPPKSSRVTINLRTNRPLDVILSSPESPTISSKMVEFGEDTGTRISVESESDALSNIPLIETPSSSNSPEGSPKVELVVEDDFDFGTNPVAIIGDEDDEDDNGYIDPLSTFPYYAEGETLVNTVSRLARHLQYGICYAPSYGFLLTFVQMK